MAEVYRAEQQLAGGISRPVALKVIRPEYSESTDFHEMFLDEARTACTLSHPNIVHIYEVGEFEGLLYMTMELVPGASLSAVARGLEKRDERFDAEMLLAVGISTCAALEAVHRLKPQGEPLLNLVHRDISPQNLLLSPDGTLKLIDFGIAKAATNRNLTHPGMTKGKVGYFSPEQAMGKSLDGRSDLFSLGVTLYRLASGRTPFEDVSNPAARNRVLLSGQWQSLERVCPGLPVGFYTVLNRALRVEPEERFDNARDMREALEAVALDKGLRVGPSALRGYVDEREDGVIVVAPQRVRTVSQSLMPLPPHRDLSLTVHASSLPAPKSRRWLRRGGMVAGCVALAVLGSSLWHGARGLFPGRGDDSQSQWSALKRKASAAVPWSSTLAEAEAARRRGPLPSATLTTGRSLEGSALPEPGALVPLNPEAAAVEHSVLPRLWAARSRKLPAREPVRSASPARSAAGSQGAPVPTGGMGTLRIGSSAQSGSVRVRVRGQAREDLPFTLQRAEAGLYDVEFLGPGNRRTRCVATVRPDQRTRVLFNGSICRIDQD